MVLALVAACSSSKDTKSPAVQPRGEPDAATSVPTSTPTPTPTPSPTPSPSPCNKLTRADCLASTHCTLHWVKQSVYACRPDDGPCEIGIAQTDRDACEAKPECAFEQAMCYCPFPGYGATEVPDVIPKDRVAACACGGGKPTMCRKT